MHQKIDFDLAHAFLVTVDSVANTLCLQEALDPTGLASGAIQFRNQVHQVSKRCFVGEDSELVCAYPHFKLCTNITEANSATFSVFRNSILNHLDRLPYTVR